MKKCESCKQFLIPIDGQYVHPSNPCSENDGMSLEEVDELTHKVFSDKYGTPELSFNEELKRHLASINHMEHLLLLQLQWPYVIRFMFNKMIQSIQDWWRNKHGKKEL